MSVYDLVTCQYPLPDDRDVPQHIFQTKSLWGCLDRLTITEEGRLILHQYQSQPVVEVDRNDFEVWKRTDIDLNYHGDLDLYSFDRLGHTAHYAVRFTHGTVEWIRIFGDLTALHRAWILPTRW